MKALSTFVLLFISVATFAQIPYKTAIGLGIDFGNGSTMFGPQIKHALSNKANVQGQVLFSDYNYTVIGADYQVSKPLGDLNNILGYLGVGPQIGFSSGYTDFSIRPQAGLEAKLPDTPLGLHFDWKPSWRLNHGSNLQMGRFSFGIKYIIK